MYTSIPGFDQCNTNQNMQNCGSILHSLKEIKTVFRMFYQGWFTVKTNGGLIMVRCLKLLFYHEISSAMKNCPADIERLSYSHTKIICF